MISSFDRRSSEERKKKEFPWFSLFGVRLSLQSHTAELPDCGAACMEACERASLANPRNLGFLAQQPWSLRIDSIGTYEFICLARANVCFLCLYVGNIKSTLYTCVQRWDNFQIEEPLCLSYYFSQNV